MGLSVLKQRKFWASWNALVTLASVARPDLAPHWTKEPVTALEAIVQETGGGDLSTK